MSRFHIQRGLRRQRGWITAVVGIFLAVSLVIVLAFSAVFLLYRQNLSPLSDSQEPVVVLIEEGASATQIAQQLKQAGVIRAAWAFDWYTRLQNVRAKLQAGSYKFAPAESVQEIVDRLEAGDVATDLFTIYPAQRVDQIKAAFLQAGFPRDEINSAFQPQQYATHPALMYKPPEASLEGYLYPETFQRTAATTVSDIIRASLDEMANILSMKTIQAIQQRGLNPHEAVILASIVEREVPAASDDRPTVAQVYLKRLQEGMLLQADPTAQYGTLLATGTQDGWRTYDTPYNTYIYPGLPPGPIANISESSLLAVAYPADTDFLFFVADDSDDNITHFSRTLDEHEENISKYCKVKCSSY